MAQICTGALAAPADSARVSLGAAGTEALQDNRWYMVGRLLGPKSRFPGFKGTISSIWRIKSGLSVHDAGDRFMFQFNHEADRNRALHGGPWFYRNTMLLLGAYDGVGLVETVPLWEMEIWVAVKGLPVALRNKNALNLIGSAVGPVIKFDQSTLRRREEEQRIRLVLDIRRRVRTWMLFEFSPLVQPEITLIYEKVKGFCRDCGYFEHDAMGCDGFLVKEKAELQNGPPEAAMAGLSLAVDDMHQEPVLAPMVEQLLSPDETGKGMEIVLQQEEAGIGGVLQDSMLHGIVGGHASHGSEGVHGSMIAGVEICPPIGMVENGGVGWFKNWKTLVLEVSKAMVLPAQTLTKAKKGLLKSDLDLGSSSLAVVGSKRRASYDLLNAGKRLLSLPAPALKVDENITLVLQHKNGQLIISPKKKKLGRPRGSKNKPKTARPLEPDLKERKSRKWKSLSNSAEVVETARVAKVTTPDGIDTLDKGAGMDEEAAPPRPENI